VQKRALLIERDQLEHDEVIGSVERTFRGTELHSRVVRVQRRHFVNEVDAMRVLQRLVGLLAHCSGELRTRIVGDGLAVLHVEMEDQRLAQIRRLVESRSDRRKRVGSR